MRTTLKYFAYATLAGTAICAAIAPMLVGAQNESAATSPNGPQAPATLPATDHELDAAKELAEQSARLKADTEAALDSLDAKQRQLDDIAKDAKAAQQFVEELMKLLNDTADRFAPNSPYMKTLTAHEEFVRGEANRALSSLNPSDFPYGRQLEAQAREIASMQTEGRRLAGKLAGEIDRLRKSAPQIGYARMIERTAEFIATARAYLDTARQVLQSASNLAAKAESIARPTVPTQ
jgi:ABC-type transporter Mla subunit MlaD